MRKGQYPTYVDPCLGEVFSIGVTILSSGTLEDTDTLYRLNPYELRRDRLQQLLFKFKEKYSDYLYQTVTSMVEVNLNSTRNATGRVSANMKLNRYLKRMTFTMPIFRLMSRS